ncbi:MAG: hypothetical protein AAGF11_09460 [Myxococcota bacterium]
MNRTLAAMRTDVALQARNQLYAISVGMAVVLAGVLSWLSSPAQLHRTVPMALLLIVGGSTLLYVIAMVILEKDDGTLQAVVVSPLRPREYLDAKIVTLSALATLEGVIMTAGTVVWVGRDSGIHWPSPWLLVGVFALGVIHTYIGVILVVRHRRIMEALLPAGGLATLLQVPSLYFVGAFSHPALLAIPSAAPSMLIRGAFVPLEAWEWIYALTYSAVLVVMLRRWARVAYEHHVVRKGGI